MPEQHVTLRGFPVLMVWNLFREELRQQSEGAWEHQPLTRVAINETVPKEYRYGLSVGLGSVSSIKRLERVFDLCYYRRFI